MSFVTHHTVSLAAPAGLGSATKQLQFKQQLLHQLQGRSQLLGLQLEYATRYSSATTASFRSLRDGLLSLALGLVTINLQTADPLESQLSLLAQQHWASTTAQSPIAPAAASSPGLYSTLGAIAYTAFRQQFTGQALLPAAYLRSLLQRFWSEHNLTQPSVAAKAAAFVAYLQISQATCDQLEKALALLTDLPPTQQPDCARSLIHRLHAQTAAPTIWSNLYQRLLLGELPDWLAGLLDDLQTLAQTSPVVKTFYGLTAERVQVRQSLQRLVTLAGPGGGSLILTALAVQSLSDLIDQLDCLQPELVILPLNVLFSRRDLQSLQGAMTQTLSGAADALQVVEELQRLSVEPVISAQLRQLVALLSPVPGAANPTTANPTTADASLLQRPTALTLPARVQAQSFVASTLVTDQGLDFATGFSPLPLVNYVLREQVTEATLLTRPGNATAGGSSGIGSYASRGLTTPLARSPIGAINTAYKVLQGTTDVAAERWAGWSTRQLKEVHLEADTENSELQTLECIAQQPALTQVLQRYKADLMQSGQHAAEVSWAYVPDYSYGNDLKLVHGIFQTNAQQFRVHTSTLFTVESPAINLVSEQYLLNGKFAHLATDLYQASHQHFVLRAEELNAQIALTTTRYNIDSLQETSANALHVTGNHVNYADFEWHQVGQVSPLATGCSESSESEPNFLPAGTGNGIHPQRSRLEGAPGTSVNLAMQDYYIFAWTGDLVFDANQELYLHSNQQANLYAGNTVAVDAGNSVSLSAGSSIALDAAQVFINCGRFTPVRSRPVTFQPRRFKQLSDVKLYARDALQQPTRPGQVGIETPAPASHQRGPDLGASLFSRGDGTAS